MPLPSNLELKLKQIKKNKKKEGRQYQYKKMRKFERTISLGDDGTPPVPPPTEDFFILIFQSPSKIGTPPS